MSRKSRAAGSGIHSVVWKLFGWTAGCIAVVLVVVLLLNSFALKGYYIRQKQKQVQQAFQTINTACDDPEALYGKLLDMQDNGAVTTMLWSDRRLLYSTLSSDRFRILGNISYPPGTYELAITDEDSIMGGGTPGEQAILLIGTLDNGWHIYLRTSVAAIEDSVALTNRFLLLTGLGVLPVGLLLVLLVAQRYARPIRELSGVADRVARLDFGGRYTGGAHDELDALGESINTMSAALEQAVTQLRDANTQLEADIRQKEQQDAARRAFIANVSHELKTPIALIGTYAEGLRENIAANGEEREYYCSVIEDEAHRISQLLRRMTMLMQLEGGGSQLEIERFDIAELARNLLERFRPEFEAKSVTVSAPPSEPVPVAGDSYLLENVLVNFLSNAIHHVPDGGRVAVRLTPLWADGAVQRIRVTVFNSGSHIPPEELSRVWESFYKVDKARTRAYGGSGIGLSVVAAIMKAHGMPYGVENLPDGIAFYIELESG